MSIVTKHVADIDIVFGASLSFVSVSDVQTSCFCWSTHIYVVDDVILGNDLLMGLKSFLWIIAIFNFYVDYPVILLLKSW